MLRLRTTTALSLAALAVGIIGTHWLSGLNTGWAGPSERVAGFVPAAHPTRPASARRLPRAAPALVVTPRVARPSMPVEAPAKAPAAAPPLVPLSIPQTPVSWAQMEGHLHGRVLLRVRVDGSGHVTEAELAQSSGDAVLDAHALASVRDWRFAVPAGYPDGFSGELPMRYTGDGQRVAQAP